MNIPASLQPLAELFQMLDGKGQLWSPSRQFLGLLSSNPNHPNSIINPDGVHGSPHSLISIHNPKGLYGGSQGTYSPYNINSVNPPIIVYKGKPLLVVTWNCNISTNGLKIINADLMIAIYEELSTSSSKPWLSSPQTAPSYVEAFAKTKLLANSLFGVSLSGMQTPKTSNKSASQRSVKSWPIVLHNNSVAL